MRSVLITGANRGIGWATTRDLAHQGYFVYLACRSFDAGARAVETLKEEGFENAACVRMDVTDKESIDRAVAEVTKRSDTLDALINNAGILGNRNDDGTVSVEEVERVFATNLFGVMRVTNAFLPLLRRSDAPRIVHVTSGLGSLTLQSDPTSEFYRFKSQAYFPSKAALNAYCIVLAAELKDAGFKVNVVDPGYTATAFNAYRGTRKPEDAAKLIVRAATLDNDAPTGRFLSESEGSKDGELPW